MLHEAVEGNETGSVLQLRSRRTEWDASWGTSTASKRPLGLGKGTEEIQSGPVHKYRVQEVGKALLGVGGWIGVGLEQATREIGEPGRGGVCTGGKQENKISM